MLHNHISSPTEQYLFQEIARFHHITSLLLELADEQYIINEQLQRNIKIDYSNIERVFEMQKNIRVILGE